MHCSLQWNQDLTMPVRLDAIDYRMRGLRRKATSLNVAIGGARSDIKKATFSYLH